MILIFLNIHVHPKISHSPCGLLRWNIEHFIAFLFIKTWWCSKSIDLNLRLNILIHVSLIFVFLSLQSRPLVIIVIGSVEIMSPSRWRFLLSNENWLVACHTFIFWLSFAAVLLWSRISWELTLETTIGLDEVGSLKWTLLIRIG